MKAPRRSFWKSLLVWLALLSALHFGLFELSKLSEVQSPVSEGRLYIVAAMSVWAIIDLASIGFRKNSSRV